MKTDILNQQEKDFILKYAPMADTLRRSNKESDKDLLIRLYELYYKLNGVVL